MCTCTLILSMWHFKCNYSLQPLMYMYVFCIITRLCYVHSTFPLLVSVVQACHQRFSRTIDLSTEPSPCQYPLMTGLEMSTTPTTTVGYSKFTYNVHCIICPHVHHVQRRQHDLMIPHDVCVYRNAMTSHSAYRYPTVYMYLCTYMYLRMCVPPLDHLTWCTVKTQ